MPLRFFKRDSSPRETCHLFLRSAPRVPLVFMDLRKRFNRLSSDSFGFLMTVVTYLTPLFASLCSYDLVKIAKATTLFSPDSPPEEGSRPFCDSDNSKCVIDSTPYFVRWSHRAQDPCSRASDPMLPGGVATDSYPLSPIMPWQRGSLR